LEFRNLSSVCKTPEAYPIAKAAENDLKPTIGTINTQEHCKPLKGGGLTSQPFRQKGRHCNNSISLLKLFLKGNSIRCFVPYNAIVVFINVCNFVVKFYTVLSTKTHKTPALRSRI